MCETSFLNDKFMLIIKVNLIFGTLRKEKKLFSLIFIGLQYFELVVF